VKRPRGSTEIPGARPNAVAMALPHDKSDIERAAELEKLLERVAVPAAKAGRRQPRNDAPADGRSKLALVDDPLPPPGPSTHAANTAFVARTFELASGTSGAIDYIAIAKSEFDAGRIDQPLWARAFVEAGGDESSAMPSYLRARATALRLKARVRQSEGSDHQARAGTPSRAPSGDPASRHVAAAGVRRSAGSDRTAKALLRSPITILAALICIVVVVTFIIAPSPRDRAVEPIAAARTAGAIQPGPAATGGAAISTSPGADQDVRTTIQRMKEAGNWNDVVAQAAAWTEKEPQNAAAWNELSIGYINVRRQDDAHAAARKAVELAPKNAEFWRNLGQLSLDLDSPIEALLAFEEATRWNAKDARSLVQAGILNARLDHLAEAKAAFDSALALNAADADARCGAAFVAQRQRRSDDPKGGVKPPDPTNPACRNLIDQASKGLSAMAPR
jgi:hypothetical protein